MYGNGFTLHTSKWAPGSTGTHGLDGRTLPARRCVNPPRQKEWEENTPGRQGKQSKIMTRRSRARTVFREAGDPSTPEVENENIITQRQEEGPHHLIPPQALIVLPYIF